MRLRSFVTAATLAVAATTASAQDVRQPPRQTLGTNLLAIPFGVFSLDYEHAIGAQGFAFGLGGLHIMGGDDADGGGDWFFDDGELSWAQAKLKYYPGDVTLQQFSVGVTAGVVREKRFEYVYVPYDPANPPTQPPPRRGYSDVAPTLGVVVDYNFLLGRQKRFLLGVGVGAKRVLKNVERRGSYTLEEINAGKGPSPLNQVYPDGRFTVGFAF